MEYHTPLHRLHQKPDHPTSVIRRLLQFMYLPFLMRRRYRHPLPISQGSGQSRRLFLVARDKACSEDFQRKNIAQPVQRRLQSLHIDSEGEPWIFHKIFITQMISRHIAIDSGILAQCGGKLDADLNYVNRNLLPIIFQTRTLLKCNAENEHVLAKY